jgi:trehalose 6-phosphate synthase
MSTRSKLTSPAAKVWTKEGLHELIATHMRDVRFISVSNREPYTHTRANSHIHIVQPASGLATALDPVMRASGGVWVAQGSGNADR